MESEVIIPKNSSLIGTDLLERGSRTRMVKEEGSRRFHFVTTAAEYGSAVDSLGMGVKVELKRAHVMSRVRAKNARIWKDDVSCR